MKGRKTSLEIALNGCTLRLFTEYAFLGIMITRRYYTIVYVLTSLHLVLGILSMWSMGSMKS